MLLTKSDFTKIQPCAGCRLHAEQFTSRLTVPRPRLDREFMTKLLKQNDFTRIQPCGVAGYVPNSLFPASRLQTRIAGSCVASASVMHSD